ncbi:hypothetical protein, partial [Streptomyces triticirhizae]
MVRETATSPALERQTQRLRLRGLRLQATEAAVALLSGEPDRTDELRSEVDAVLAGHEARRGDTVLVDTREGRLTVRMFMDVSRRGLTQRLTDFGSSTGSVGLCRETSVRIHRPG